MSPFALLAVLYFPLLAFGRLGALEPPNYDRSSNQDLLMDSDQLDTPQVVQRGVLGASIPVQNQFEPAELPVTGYSQQQSFEQSQSLDDEQAPPSWHAVQEPLAQVQSSRMNVAPQLNLVSMHGPKGQAGLRPGFGTGAPDVIKFGLFAKAFYGAKLNSNKFTADVVMNMKWTDTRASAILNGAEKMTLSGKEALSKIWTPQIVVTNRDIRKYEIISTAFIVYKDGTVQKIERAGAIMNNRYELENYPFDTQKMLIKVASQKYMADDIVLEPDDDSSSSGVNADLFKGQPYELPKENPWRVYAFEEKDGALVKSRGVLEIRAKRLTEEYVESHIVPGALLLMISWGVFWFPFQQPFVTPRLALSILALLTFTQLGIKSDGALPDGAPHNWNDILNQNIQMLMFCTIVLNIFSEICKHHLGHEDVAKLINSECRFLMPALGMVVCVFVLTCGATHCMPAPLASVITKCVIAVVFAIYIGLSMTSVFAAAAEKAAIEEEKKAAADAEEEKKRLEKIRGIGLDNSSGPAMTAAGPAMTAV